jgi:hypothetical protein
MKYICNTSLNTTLKGTPEEASELNTILSHPALSCIDENPPNVPGFTAQYCAGTQSILIFNSTDDAHPDELTPEHIKAIRTLIIANRLEYIEFGFAFHASQPMQNAYDGGLFRVYASSKHDKPIPHVVWPKLLWPLPERS